jgi:hypothetical protein
LQADDTTEFQLRREDLAWRVVEQGEVVALDLRSSEYFTLNGSATVLWHLLAEGATRRQLADALVEGFEISRERAVQDVDDFLASCARARLLEEPEQARATGT